MRPPRAASAADTGFARARRLGLGTDSYKREEDSYKREARRLKASHCGVEVHIANFGGCGSGGRSAATKVRATQDQAGGAEVGGWCGGKATVSAVAGQDRPRHWG